MTRGPPSGESGGIRVGVAGWAPPRHVVDRFPGSGTHLQRYAQVFNAVEINSTFRRKHRAETFGRWAKSVPAGFQFSVKFPKAITHDARLVGVEEPLKAFLSEAASLGAALGPLLLQLPPTLAFDPLIVGPFCERLASLPRFDVACEPRHASWFTPKVDRWLKARRISRVAADPALHPGAGDPGGWRGLSYHRLHGSPKTYHSHYDSSALAALEARLERDQGAKVWCIFDNTAAGAATPNALTVAGDLRRRLI
jgi:uncharacterized protein YecE (DUF72 family)